MTDSARQYAANIPKYFIYAAIKGFVFSPFAALWAIFLIQHRGMTLAEAALVDVTFFVSAAFGEVPTGIIADRYGRKTSLVIGAALMSIGALGWTFSPIMPLIMLSYISMGIGFTCLSGAEDALFYESIKLAGRGDDYTRLVGRANAITMGALALGSITSGLIGAISLTLPFVISGSLLIALLGIALTFKEPERTGLAEGESHPSFVQIFRQSFALMRARPALRYSLIYLALIPMAAFMLDAVFLQPQSLALGVPVAGIGVIVMTIQLTNMFGANASDWLKSRIGEVRLLYAAPIIVIACVVLLAIFQILPALLLIVVTCLLTAALRPILMNRVQSEVSDEVRATVISMQSLMFTTAGAISQPTLAYIADHSGFPAAYFVLAGVLSLIIIVLFWVSRGYFPSAAAHHLDPLIAEPEPAP